MKQYTAKYNVFFDDKEKDLRYEVTFREESVDKAKERAEKIGKNIKKEEKANDCEMVIMYEEV